MPAPSSEATEAAAERIAMRVQQRGQVVGFDPMSLIMLLTTLLPQLITCGNQPPKSAAAYVAARYDEDKGRYDPALVRQVMLRIRRKARKEGHPLSQEDVEALAIATLDEARQGDNQAAWAEAPALSPRDE
jgi:hypothetical protein